MHCADVVFDVVILDFDVQVVEPVVVERRVGTDVVERDLFIGP